MTTSDCEAAILRVLDAQDGKTAMFGCVACGWEERVPVRMRDGKPEVTTAHWCRRNPPKLEVGLLGGEESDPDAVRVAITKT